MALAAPFSVEPSSGVLGANEQRQLCVSFEPPGEEHYTDTLRICYDQSRNSAIATATVTVASDMRSGSPTLCRVAQRRHAS